MFKLRRLLAAANDVEKRPSSILPLDQWQKKRQVVELENARNVEFAMDVRYFLGVFQATFVESANN